MKKLTNRGQSSIEFILSMAFILALFFVFVNQAFNFGIGYLAHYATFMASRSYMVHDTGRMLSSSDYIGIVESSKAVGKKVFERHRLDVFLGKSVGDVKFNAPIDGSFYEFSGAHFQYQRPFSTYEFFGGGMVIDYLTESFLGKEPTRIECKVQTCLALTGSECDGAGEMMEFTTIYDNGC